ncbi:glycoside hydrolase family 130 protein [Chryseobacterium joostei]|uniref:glycoside hydrolase family 130 protein n=1 Tax=Chryseobacterium joostei TaxID=112234 RepID=UPI0023F04C9A|nr:glycoside hydrolase family 130 protein [Chryseobacterium joostei]
MITIKKLPIRITPSSTRTLVRPFVPGNTSQIEHVLSRISSIDKQDQELALGNISKYLNIPDEKRKAIFLRHFGNIKNYVSSDVDIPDRTKEFIGACFTQQYSLESTALFNPSIVPHPVQDKKGVTKFIMSLRAIGEGHISSITFMEGEIDSSFNVSLKENSPLIYESERKEQLYEKQLFVKKLKELGLLTDHSRPVFDHLPDYFSYAALEQSLTKIRDANVLNTELENILKNIKFMALSNFTISFSTDDLSERAIYPASPSHSNGLEDARFVKFTNDDGSVVYYATFTAYNGRTIMPEMLETTDFKEFTVSTLNGPMAKNKGLALFPRKVNGSYMMLGRQDNESLYLMTSDNPYFWYNCQPLAKPTYCWELMQIGNCGSPMEIEEGWLVLTHGVGPLRTYSLGVMLLDKNEPWKILGRSTSPLLEAAAEERRGYVPNVIYTCGGMVIDRTLVLPYGVGDVLTTFALISIDEILINLKRQI